MRRSLITTLVVAMSAALVLVASPSQAVPLRGEGPPPAVPVAPPNTTTAGTGVEVEAKFVSSLGWVKPAELYPFRVILRNKTAATVDEITVTITAPPGAELLSTNDPANDVVAPGVITWTPPDLAPGTAAAPTTTTLVVEARSLSQTEAATIVWQDLSAAATLDYAGLAAPVTSTTHGPKVIPDDPAYETARYGDRPFPVVPVAYQLRSNTQSAELLSQKLNDKNTPGSTFNLYQELSYGQLFPQASIPSAGIATANFTYGPGFDFTEVEPGQTCTGGVTLGSAAGSPAYEQRIIDGWYQLPGNTEYYGADANGSALVGAQAGVAALQVIDQGCGDIGKGVFDAAQIADPEINYDDYDTDKDGVVDFFMMVFPGLGGNGDSQLNGTPPYDNIWPHSSSLEFGYVDEVTGLGGYTSDDQLVSLEGVPQCWVDTDYDAQGDCGSVGDDTLPVFVRVGPYNVNPESAIEKASVISHEYGHSLGLPDFYSTGGRETYGDFNLMATDKSQGMDVYSRQELGWVVPSPLEDGPLSNLPESDTDIHRIEWETDDGTPYTLEGEDVHNGPAWMAKLPARKIIAADFVEAQASGRRLWWSQAGNDYGCPPNRGHNLDFFLPELAAVPAGTDVTLDFKSYFDIEWDYDYGFVLVSIDGGNTFTSLASLNGYTTPGTQNPNANLCQTQFGNGITGTGGSYDAGTAPVDRVLANYGEPSFVEDSYDLSDLAGEEVVLRFSYATDPALTRPGWFIDDLALTAGGEDLYVTDFEDDGGPDDPRVFNGGCQEGLGTKCTKGWQFTDTLQDSAADHAYYLELRDRSGFDEDGKDENDRDPIAFEPGLLLVYTDESHGLGNAGTDDPPAQSPLDSQPEPGETAPDLSDATFTAAADDTHFDDEAWIDNYEDPRRDVTCLADCDNPVLAQEINPWLFDFDCLSVDVLGMTGEDVGPDLSPGNLTADLAVDVSDGCVPFDFGRGGLENRAPTARLQAKATTITVGDSVQLDGSGSFDDLDVPSDLTFAWTVVDGGSAGSESVAAASAGASSAGLSNADGATTSASFDEPGEYVVRLSVEDTEGLADTDEVTLTVEAANTPDPGPDTDPVRGPGGSDRLPATGTDAGPMAAGLGLLVLALGLRRLAR